MRDIVIMQICIPLFWFLNINWRKFCFIFSNMIWFDCRVIHIFRIDENKASETFSFCRIPYHYRNVPSLGNRFILDNILPPNGSGDPDDWSKFMILLVENFILTILLWFLEKDLCLLNRIYEQTSWHITNQVHTYCTEGFAFKS